MGDSRRENGAETGYLEVSVYNWSVIKLSDSSQHMSIRKGVGLLSAGVFVVGTEVGLERSMDGSSRGIVTQARQKGRSNELTTGLDNNKCLLYCLSLRIVGLECQRVMR